MPGRKAKKILPRPLPSPHSRSQIATGPIISVKGWFCAKVVVKTNAWMSQCSIFNHHVSPPSGRAEPAVHTNNTISRSTRLFYEPFSLLHRFTNLLFSWFQSNPFLWTDLNDRDEPRGPIGVVFRSSNFKPQDCKTTTCFKRSKFNHKTFKMSKLKWYTLKKLRRRACYHVRFKQCKILQKFQASKNLRDLQWIWMN
jgi:hypothetical protein